MYCPLLSTTSCHLPERFDVPVNEKLLLRAQIESAAAVIASSGLAKRLPFSGFFYFSNYFGIAGI